MADEVKDVNTEESSPLEGAVASSPEVQEKVAAQEAESATPKEAEVPAEEQQVEEGKIPYDRFKEVNDERKALRDQNQQLMDLVQKQPQQPQPTQDQYAGMTPEEKVFWQNVDARAEKKAQQVVNKTINPQLNAGVQRMAELEIQNFRMRHPEVKPNSELETRITGKVRQGYPLEEAYKLETYESRAGQQSAESAQNKQQRLEAKHKANVVSPKTQSPQTTQPSQGSFEEDLRRGMDDWDGTL